MSRSTQYIGMTKDAKEFVEGFEMKTFHLTDGMFDEEVFGTIYIDPKNKEEYKENVQFEPWSSGPMIFTNLVAPNGRHLFSWVIDSSVENEVDYENGRMYV